MRPVKIQEPTSELQAKIVRARIAIASQQPRIIKCPYCHRNLIVVFEDTVGHVQTKCKNCGHETVLDLVNMRRVRNPRTR